MMTADKAGTGYSPFAKIGDDPLKVTDTGLKFKGKRILIQGDKEDADHFVWLVERYYPGLRQRINAP